VEVWGGDSATGATSFSGLRRCQTQFLGGKLGVFNPVDGEALNSCDMIVGKVICEVTSVAHPFASRFLFLFKQMVYVLIHIRK
jgi:hypothetical protein